METSKLNKIIRADGIETAFTNIAYELQKKEAFSVRSPEEQNIINPDCLKEIYKEYYSAGADIFGTNTIKANRKRLKFFNLEMKVKEINKRAVEIAREVITEDKIIAGVIGPLGELIKPLGEITEGEAFDIFGEQAAALEEAGADFILIKNMTAIDEITIAVMAAKENTSLPVSASMIFDKVGKSIETFWGVKIKTALEILTELEADIIGFNCCNNIDQLNSVLNEIVLSEKPVNMQVYNSFQKDIKNNHRIYDNIFKSPVKIIEGGSNMTSADMKNLKDFIEQCKIEN